MANYQETKGGSRRDRPQVTSEILQDKNCRLVLNTFKEDKLRSIEDVFGSLSLMRHEVIISLEKLCAEGFVKITVAGPHVFFGLSAGTEKKLQELLEKFDNN